MNKLKKKTLLLALVLLAGLLLPSGMNAQDCGMLGYGNCEGPAEGFSLFGRSGGGLFDDLSLQDFGEDQDDLSLQNFGEDTPLGSGWLVLMTAGLGYAAMKTRKNKKQTKSVK